MFCCSGVAISAGEYSTPSWFGIPLTVQVDEGWRVLNEGAALLFAIVRGASNPPHLPSELIVFLDASSAQSVDALMGQFLAEPAITPVGEATETTLAGFDGVQQDFSVLPNPDNKGNPERDIPPGVRTIPVMGRFFSPGFAWTSSTPEARMRVIAVDTGDTLLLVTLEAPPVDFASFVADAGGLLETLIPLEP